MESKKYPRTFHLPYSPKVSNDDKMWTDKDIEDQFLNIKLIITEKLDGSNVCLTSEQVFSRSHSGPPTHPSFSTLKVLHSNIKHKIPKGISVFGEWCFAVHAIQYYLLPHHLNIFGVRLGDNDWLDWDDVCDFAKDLGVPTVPVLLSGCFVSKQDLKNSIEFLSKLSSIYGLVREGLVIRKQKNIIQENEKLIGVGKYVNASFKPGNENWSKNKITKQPVILNY